MERGAYSNRKYREQLRPDDLVAFEVTVAETNLFICAQRDLSELATRLVRKARGDIESYAAERPAFYKSLEPLEWEQGAPDIIRRMCEAGQAAGVGPMAAVAGAIAEVVASGVLQKSDEVIVENGGDVFLAGSRERIVAIWAGSSKLSQRVGLRIPAESLPLAVCTSSGKVGHSLSLGRADAAVVVAERGGLADAAATAVANLVQAPEDVERALESGKQIAGVQQVVVIAGEALGAWGQYELVPL
ncbi:MAG: UPF0280 family protein [Armatimonadota bacterium]